MSYIVERLRATKEWAAFPAVPICIEAADEIERLTAERDTLRAALKALIEASGHMSPFGGEASVKNVRKAGKYMKALEAAEAALEKPSKCLDTERSR
jgi:hypothetical protein